MSGKLIVIEGLDGSGKATQAGLLYDKLSEDGIPVMKVSFPDYDSQSSALIKMYLQGEFGMNPGDVNAYAASSFYAVDRYASYKKNWANFYDEGGIIIADRYTTSNAIHQCSKLNKNEWDTFLDWLFQYEYKLLGIPEPDLIIYLKTDPELSQKLMNQRYSGDESKKDIHESNMDYLRLSQQAAEYCSGKLGWNTVCCDDGNTMRSAETIHNEIMNMINIIKRI